MRPAFLLLLAAGLLGAQQPTLSNARFETRAVAGDPLSYLRQLVASENGPVWIGYAVDSNQKDNNSCCWENNCAGCRLEGGRGSIQGRVFQNGEPVKLEGSGSVAILYRVEGKAIGKIHPVSIGCPLDAGGLRFLWLTGVSPQASVAFLSEQVTGSSGSKHDADSALVSIAMHAAASADEALERFASPANPEWLREKALFWLASSRGDRGFQAVKHAAEHDSSNSIREKAMFDFSLCKEPQAIEELIHFAKTDPSSQVRGQALFWLSQKAGNRAVQGIRDAIENDPDTEVKKKAVFALQQLPKDEGVPMLIEIAKTNRNPEVRKQAMFWLGQSRDPRAVAFFAEILAR
jgi:hypothetical protein